MKNKNQLNAIYYSYRKRVIQQNEVLIAFCKENKISFKGYRQPMRLQNELKLAIRENAKPSTCNALFKGLGL